MYWIWDRTQMGADDVRLLLLAIAVTTMLVAFGGGSLWSFVQARRQSPDAFAVLTQTVGEMSVRVRNLERERENDHRLIMRLQSELEMQKTYSRELAERLRGLGQEVPAAPVPPPEIEPPATVGPAGEEAQLMPQVIAALFNIEEIDDLAFQLGVNVDELDGATVSKRARSLVTYMRRRGRMDELVALVRELRPKTSF